MPVYHAARKHSLLKRYNWLARRTLIAQIRQAVAAPIRTRLRGASPFQVGMSDLSSPGARLFFDFASRRRERCEAY